MATERQIAANKRNAGRSSGPRSDSGRSRSRLNATKHGLAAVLPEAEAAASPEFLRRRREWAAGVTLVDPAAHWAMDRAVAASLRIERCERAFDEVIRASRERATLAWDEDREIEAGGIFERLGREPVLASRQLRGTLAGVGLLIEAWLGLAVALEDGSDWSEAEASRALDLLGVAPDIRRGRTMLDPVDETDPVAFRRDLAFEEVEKLEASRDESMAPLDAMDQRRALVGDFAVLSKPASLVMRYERDAWRRYRQAMSEVRGGAPAVDPAHKPRKLADPGVNGGRARRPSGVASIPGPAVGSSTAARPPSASPPEERPIDPPSPYEGLRPSSAALAPRPEALPPVQGAGKDKAGERKTSRSERKPTAAPSEPTFEERRRALQAEAAPIRQMVTDRLRSMGLDDEDAWLEELERRVEAGPAGYRVTERTQFSGTATERTQFGGTAADPGLARVLQGELDRPLSLVGSALADQGLPPTGSRPAVADPTECGHRFALRGGDRSDLTKR